MLGDSSLEDRLASVKERLDAADDALRRHDNPGGATAIVVGTGLVGLIASVAAASEQPGKAVAAPSVSNPLVAVRQVGLSYSQPLVVGGRSVKLTPNPLDTSWKHQPSSGPKM